MKCTHILSIQIWSEKCNQTTNYGNILNKVKNEIINKIQTYEIECNEKNEKKELLSILWYKMDWDKLDESLYYGDIVTNMPKISDEAIYEHTKSMLEEITNILCINKKFDSDYKIMFSIVKPIQPTSKEYIEYV